MVTTGNDRPFSDGDENGPSPGQRADDNPAARGGAGQTGQGEVADNAGLLDEIETLLHELSSEFPGAETPEGTRNAAPENGPAAAVSPPAETAPTMPDTARTPEFDLGKPIDYVSDPSRYDFRRASESYQADVAVRSMARKLAPAVGQAGSEPAPAPPPAPAPAAPAFSEPLPERVPTESRLADSAEAEERQDSEKWGQRRRRLRLRPARRVPGSRPEAQFAANLAAMNQSSDADWDPRPARQRAAGRPVYSAAMGAGVTLLIIAAAGGTFALIEPLNRFLPEPIALVLDSVSGGVSEQEDGSGNAAVDVRLASGSVISEEARKFKGSEQVREAAMADLREERSSAAEPLFETAAGQPATAEPVTVRTPKIAPIDAEPVISTAGLAESVSTQPVAAEPVAAEPVRSAQPQSDKSAERLNQDAVVQATLKDPQKRALALADAAGDNGNAGSTVIDEPVTTGAISSTVADDRIRGANAVARQASATNAEIAGKVRKRTLETRETVKIAGLAHSAPFGTIEGADSEAGPQVKTAALQPDQPIQSRPGKTSLGETGIGVPGSSIDGLLARGHELLQQGDIASARLLFRRVVAMGDSRGAKGMGMTYDPRVYQNLPVAGMSADSEQAEFWYRKARELSEVKPAPDATATDTMSVSGN